jgi:hypothetical protein
LFVVVLLAVAVIADAQQPKKVPRLGEYQNSEAAWPHDTTIDAVSGGQGHQVMRRNKATMLGLN